MIWVEKPPFIQLQYHLLGERRPSRTGNQLGLVKRTPRHVKAAHAGNWRSNWCSVNRHVCDTRNPARTLPRAHLAHHGETLIFGELMRNSDSSFGFTHHFWLAGGGWEFPMFGAYDASLGWWLSTRTKSSAVSATRQIPQIRSRWPPGCPISRAG